MIAHDLAAFMFGLIVGGGAGAALMAVAAAALLRRHRLRLEVRLDDHSDP